MAVGGDLGCLRGRSRVRWGTRAPKVIAQNMHFIMFCPLEEHPRGQVRICNTQINIYLKEQFTTKSKYIFFLLCIVLFIHLDSFGANALTGTQLAL